MEGGLPTALLLNTWSSRLGSFQKPMLKCAGMSPVVGFLRELGPEYRYRAPNGVLGPGLAAQRSFSLYCTHESGRDSAYAD